MAQEQYYQTSYFDKLEPEIGDPQAAELAEKGVVFSRVPEEIYPGMLYTTPSELVQSGVTRYTQNHIRLLVNLGKIDGY